MASGKKYRNWVWALWGIGACLSLASSPAWAATYTWDGGGSTDNWSDTGNWRNNLRPFIGGMPDDTIVFPTTGKRLFNSINDIASPSKPPDNDFELKELIHSNLGLPVLASLEGGPLKFQRKASRIANLGDVSLTIENDLRLHTHLTVDQANADGGFNSRISLNGNLSGPGDLIKVGTGTVILDGDNRTWTGDLRVWGGRVVMGNEDPLGDQTMLEVLSGSTVVFSANPEVFGALTGSGVVLTGSGGLAFGMSNASTTFLGSISGNGQLIKRGTGMMTLGSGASVQTPLLRSRDGGTLRVNGATIVTDLLGAKADSKILIESGSVDASSVFKNSSTSLIDVAGGTLRTDLVSGDLINSGGTFARLNDTTGPIDFNGGYTQGAAGTLSLRIGGSGEQSFDYLFSDAAVSIDGTLDVQLINDFELAVFDEFAVIDAQIGNGEVIGTFDTLNLPDLPAGMDWDMIYEPRLVTLRVVPQILLGDANNDGLVTGADLIAVQQNFASVGSADGLMSGDANDDGLVTGADLITVQQNFGNVGNSAAPQTAAVPEPATGVLAAVGLFLTRLCRPTVRYIPNPDFCPHDVKVCDWRPTQQCLMAKRPIKLPISEFDRSSVVDRGCARARTVFHLHDRGGADRERSGIIDAVSSVTNNTESGPSAVETCMVNDLHSESIGIDVCAIGQRERCKLVKRG